MRLAVSCFPTISVSLAHIYCISLFTVDNQNRHRRFDKNWCLGNDTHTSMCCRGGINNIVDQSSKTSLGPDQIKIWSPQYSLQEFSLTKILLTYITVCHIKSDAIAVVVLVKHRGVNAMLIETRFGLALLACGEKPLLSAPQNDKILLFQ